MSIPIALIMIFVMPHVLAPLARWAERGYERVLRTYSERHESQWPLPDTRYVPLHLDHAGATGTILERVPGIRVYVHERIREANENARKAGVANLVVWTKVFEAHRRIVLGAGMIAVQGRIQREVEVVHFVVHRIHDLSRELACVGRCDGAFPLLPGCGDEGQPNSRISEPRDMYVKPCCI